MLFVLSCVCVDALSRRGVGGVGEGRRSDSGVSGRECQRILSSSAQKEMQ